MAPLKPLACSWTGLVGVGIRTIYKPTAQTAILEILYNEEILNYICVPNTCSVPSQRSWLSFISCPIVMGQYSHRGEAAGCIWRLYGLHAQNFPRTNESSHQPPRQKHSQFKRPGRSWVGRPYADKDYWGADKGCGEHRHINAQRRKQKQLFLHLQRQTYSCGEQVKEKRNGNQ